MKLNAPRWALECSVNSRGWRERLRALRWLALIDGCRRRRGGGERKCERVRQTHREDQRRAEKTLKIYQRLISDVTVEAVHECVSLCSCETWSHRGEKEETRPIKHHRGQSGSPNTMTNQTWRLTHSVCFIAKFGGSVQNWVANTPLLS